MTVAGRAETSDGVGLHVQSTGSGTPLLFLHEFAGDHRSWEPQVRYFSRSYRCVTYAARGYPPSDVPEDPAAYSQQRAVADAVAVLDSLGIERAHVAGLSMGGFAALHLLLSHPDRVISAVVAGTGYGAPPGRVAAFRAECEAIAAEYETRGAQEVARWYAAGPARVQFQNKNPRGWAEFAAALGEHSAAGAALTMRGVQAKRPSLYELAAELAAVRTPVLLVAGDEDEGCLETVLMLKHTIPTCGLVLLPQTGHTANLEEPELFNAAVDRFLAAAERGAWRQRDPRSLVGSVTGMTPPPAPGGPPTAADQSGVPAWPATHPEPADPGRTTEPPPHHPEPPDPGHTTEPPPHHPEPPDPGHTTEPPPHHPSGQAGHPAGEGYRHELVAFGKRLAADGLIEGTSGNLSIRAGELVAITPSGVPYHQITPEGICLVRLADGTVDPGGQAGGAAPRPRPSSETPMHLAVYRATGAAAIVHTHSPFVVALSCVLDVLPAVHYAMADLGGPVRVAPYTRFGTRELADAAVAALAGRNAVILRNHGALACGTSLAQAYGRARTLEWLARAYWHARLAGQPATLDDAALAEVSEAMAALRYGDPSSWAR
jgi:ribulose-5-phosphate 4-epimerase/fuculose-1-phosphate aldolase/pimeloyl-ACP methyl ester carboxylesterase